MGTATAFVAGPGTRTPLRGAGERMASALLPPLAQAFGARRDRAGTITVRAWHA
ncbi:hypothetical protein [Streptomyces thermodiastaticus]|jgi:hypothetical protein|uniref:hypothetical protein n=1 Tax=Streptomyces thermodiastaticus TaxID=44061 RepID=UPI001677A2C2|nr:hypothetical protein [Streptomyces thermodiastaticus]MCE7551393.1 hypothetical protein [Streptomyces thermodiastaticus]GHF86551.1 hypothetical protein GCM10018787_39210 [Streptomyces thermodiastaticus]